MGKAVPRAAAGYTRQPKIQNELKFYFNLIVLYENSDLEWTLTSAASLEFMYVSLLKAELDAVPLDELGEASIMPFWGGDPVRFESVP